MLFGSERSSELQKCLRGKNVGLVINQASVDHNGKSTLDIVREYCTVRAIFALEHGVRGKHKAGEDVEHEDDLDSIPVFSLYHGNGTGLDAKETAGLDAIVYDIQDLGLRFYTYIGSLRILVQNCHELGLEFIVLDRPCPFGRKIWGNLLDHDSWSFVGPDSLPVSYGMTPGESALWFADEFQYEEKPTIVKLENWHAEPYWLKGWDWVKTSPNIPDFHTAFIYAGLCFIEGTNLSEGRGTDKPFRTFGAPWIDSFIFLEKLESFDIRGFSFNPVDFTPQDSKLKDKTCHGIEITVDDYNVAEPVLLGLVVLSIAFSNWPETESLPASGDLSHMDRLVGKGIIESIINDPVGVYEDWKNQSMTFRKGWIYE